MRRGSERASDRTRSEEKRERERAKAAAADQAREKAAELSAIQPNKPIPVAADREPSAAGRSSPTR